MYEYPVPVSADKKCESRISVTWLDFRQLDDQVYLNDVNIQFFMRYIT